MGVSFPSLGARELAILLFVVTASLVNYWMHLNSGEAQCPPTTFEGLTKEEEPRADFTTSDPTVCVIVRTFHKQRYVLPALIASLASNNYPNLKVFLVDTGDDFSDLSNFPSLFNSLYSKDFVHISDITRAVPTQKFPTFTDTYGFLQTDLVVEDLSSSNHNCDYFLATNGDNLYSTDFLKVTVPHLRKSVDLVAVEFVSHYCYASASEWIPRIGCYNQHYTSYNLGRIDLGAAMFRKQKVIDSDIRFVKNSLIGKPPKRNCVGE